MSRVSRAYRRTVDKLHDVSPVKFIEKEVQDIYRKDDRLKKKFERRAEAEQGAFEARQRESQAISTANASARLARAFYGQRRPTRTIGRSSSLGVHGRLTMNRMLGGGA